VSNALLPVEPIGVGGLFIESFASFFARLCNAHGCSLCQMARFLASWRSQALGTTVTLSETTVYTHDGAGLFGYRERVEAYVDIVKDAVGFEHLRRCTLIPLRPILPVPSHDSVKSNRAWCEQCFRDDLSGNSPYDRLLWTLSGITRCPVHRVTLRTLCPRCNCVQRFYNRCGDPSICWKCDALLIGPADQLAPAFESPLGETDLCELVTSISTGELTQATVGVFGAFEATLRQIVSPVSAAVLSIAEPSGRARALKAPINPSLKTMLRKAHAAGVPLLRIVQDPVSAALEAGQLFFDRNMIAAKARIRHPKELLGDARRVLKTYVAKPLSEQLPPLWQVADEIGVTKSYLRHHLAVMVGKYQRHRHDAAGRVSAMNRARALETIGDASFVEMVRKKHMTRRQIAKEIAREAECSERLARWAMRVKRWN
jgi:hypothetical protein